jgi:alkanesulfonate monooxygenase SsuD/methylene tetrahydromethanopterin reductase-like flavin-dependent oxidoreductase (luciferase family)
VVAGPDPETLLFGINLATTAAPRSDPAAEALQAEALGFDFVSSSDHPCGTQPSYETWTMLSWIAAETTSIQVATRVLGVPYRNPAMTAKMAETFDRLSGGRLILGLGAGGSDDEFRAFGLPVNSMRDKITGLEEAVRIIRGLWTRPSFTWNGQVHRADDAPMEPKPSGPIPIWLGTFGPRALAVTGRVADGWIPSLGHAPADQLEPMRQRVVTAAEEVGRDPTAIRCALNAEARVDERAEPTPDALSGPPAAVVDRILGFIGKGFTAFNFMPVGADRAEQAERLASEIIPTVRTAL